VLKTANNSSHQESCQTHETALWADRRAFPVVVILANAFKFK
jgi:hypothetical protein